jgi:ATP-dependent exoDNAse (exonuclease V) beta subunit
MTMHKAKGLEFDTVIIPGLGKVPRGDQQPLLAAQEVPTGNGRSATVLSPMAATGSDGDPLYRYLMRIEEHKKQAEAIRLLYVAATRARRRLHLFMQVTASPDEKTGEIRVREPRSGCLLERLWPAVATEAAQAAGRLPVPDDHRDESRVWVQPHIRRFRVDFRVPPPPDDVRLADLEPREAAATTLEYEWAGNWSRHAGSVVHRWLKVIAEEGVTRFDEARLRSLRTRFVRQLEDLGTPSADIDRAASRVVDALCHAIADEKSRWILSADHAGAGCEYPVVLCTGGRFRQIVIDRTFIDGDGIRWVIDYKTATHEGGDLAAFLASEAERHGPQLRRYREAMTELGPEPVRTALYYPLLAAFREIG